MRFPRNKQIFRGQLDVAAFSGVLFILLLFVLLHSRLVFTPGVPIRLPEADELRGVIGSANVVVAVDAKGQFYFENQLTHDRLLRESLRQRVEAAREPLTLVIQMDKDVTHERFNQLSVLARAAGINSVFLARRPQATGTNLPPLRVP